ncbi:4-(cytidine 5'-diphospho)-2-C-methyl-D-erythritol kinase [Corynebacterium sp. H128]|uniref:4-(cytidine 5'-diphospho)-2-C-methyl-D-erythritol kinase n=1 Tax=unclassified Corynebacterium TaxID=2624378 RepID=UPI0030A45E99
MTSVRGRGHAKVNLHLGVGDAREDGFHELCTVFQSLSLADELTVTSIDGDSPPQSGSVVRGLEVIGLGAAEVPTTPDNLVWRAVDMVVEKHRARGGAPVPMLELTLNKGIPTAGGMAGGSADAATALLVMNKVLESYGTRLSQEELLEIAAQLGSDVPFTLLGGTMLGTGRGEQLVPMLSRGTFHWALAFNSAGLSTPRVFGKLDEMRAARPDLARAGSVDALSTALLSGDAREVAQHLANDLQAPALSLLPELRRTLRVGVDAGALAGVVSGSGPTCAFLCESQTQAAEVAEALIDAGVATATAIAQGPAAGAELA